MNKGDVIMLAMQVLSALSILVGGLSFGALLIAVSEFLCLRRQKVMGAGRETAAGPDTGVPARSVFRFLRGLGIAAIVVAVLWAVLFGIAIFLLPYDFD